MNSTRCGCAKKLSPLLGRAFCTTCWNVRRVLEVEGAADLAELRARLRTRDELLFRVADVLRRAGIEDAEVLLAELDRRCG